ncbi:Ubiquitin-like domain-containing protein [Sergentomyia squamirostris]
MSIIVSLSDLVTAICVIILISIVVVLAWKSTNVREDNLSAAVLVIENSRRRLIDRINQFHHSHSQTSGRSTSQQSNHSNDTEEVELETEVTPADDNSQPTTPAHHNDGNHFHVLSEHHERFLSQAEEIIESLEGPDEIIREMDDMSDGVVRHRHWRQPDPATTPSTPNTETHATTTASTQHPNAPKTPDASDPSTIDNCTNENNENDISEGARDAATGESTSAAAPTVDDMRIKLKYLDDVQRTVQGRPNEAIGDFKRRNFTVELAADKLVRLVFNGHVLQPDSKTLQACGLFDNCVVHCLIHKKPSSHPQRNADNVQPSTANGGEAQGIPQQPQPVNNQSSDTGSGFVYASLALLTLAIIFSWYCRYQYGSLFSWFSTVGLSIMTVIFLLMIPILVLINREVPAANV